jgi:hypothetical protein
VEQARKVEAMEPPDDDERSARKRKWQSARLKLIEGLDALGLVLERDHRFHGEDWPQHGIGIELRDESLVTSEFLVTCSRALLESEEREWGALVAVHDSTRKNGMRAIVEISNGMFTAISGGDMTRRAIFEAYHRLGLGHLLSWKP